MGLLDFFTPEAGQRRRAWLDDQSRAAGGLLDYYLGPTGVPDKVKAAAGLLDFTDAGDMPAAADASRELWNNPSIGSAANYAAAGAALALPLYSARMGQGIADLADDAVKAYDPNRVNIFAGRNAKTADLDAMRRAEGLLDSGADRADVWRDTGWMRGPDGKMRFEIDDSGAFPYVNATNGNLGDGSGRFGDVLLHDNLEAAYPDVSDIDTLYSGGRVRSGQYQPFEDREHLGLFDMQEEIGIRGRTPRDFEETALHEGQHAVQRREGFATGGNETLGRELSQEPVQGEIQALQDYIRNTQRAIASSDNPSGPFELSQAQAVKEAQEELAELQKRVVGRPRTAFDAYQRIAGEAEARNVEARRGMSATERRNTPPWQTLDVPEGEMIPIGASKAAKRNASGLLGQVGN